MKTNYPFTGPSGLVLSLASLMLPPFSNLHAAEHFTRITASPWSNVGNSRGAAWGDYDGDGFIDLFIAQAGPNGQGSALHLLYHNNRDGTFSRVTTGPVAAVSSNGRGAAWCDYDNDAHLDLVLVNQGQQNNLFHNNGDGTFAAVPDAAPVLESAPHRGVSWVDYDTDGYLDLFITVGTAGDPTPYARLLYHNNHDGTFTPITQGDFLTVPGAFFGVAWGDYNNDGRPDLFLTQALEPGGLPNYLYRNDSGGTLTRVGNPVLDGSSTCHAAAWGDYDNDGDLDLFVSCTQPGTTPPGRPNLFYRNNGDGTFTSLTSLPANDPQYAGGASVGCNWGDYDNDGWLDLFVANRFGENNFLYHNNGDGSFTKVLDSVAVNNGGDSWSAAWGDYDNDGFLDLTVGNLNGVNFLYHNNGNANHWLEFRLIGTRSNRSAIGAKVRVHATINGQSFWQMREVSGGDGYMGQNSLYVHVGLGSATNADIVRIEWPSGTVQELQNIASGQFHTVTEPLQLTATRVNGEMKLTLTGRLDSRYDIGTSTDLTTWNWNNEDIVTVTNPNGTVTFPAPGAASYPRLFYQARAH